MKIITSLLTITIITGSIAFASNVEPEPFNRSILPTPEPAFKGKIGQNYKESTPDFSPALPLKAPEGAPNILMIVLDDVGYGQLGTYGGPIKTPNIDRIADDGLRYTNFHTTALCSPTRASLLTGRNHHSVSLAAITEAATGFPSNFGSIPKSAAMIPEVLKQNGYNTFALGKWHLTPYTAYTAAGPFDRWPVGMGFEKYYGFLGGETDQWAPLLVQDNHMIGTPIKEGYHITEDLVDRTITYIKDQQQSNTGRPFFAYLSLGAAHAPLHVPKSFIDKYKGQFDQGWDKVREETYERQKNLGIITPETKLAPRSDIVRAWDVLSENEKKVYTRLQEVYAGFLDHADEHIGRLIDELQNMGIYDDTLIIVVSDNGASQEGLRDGTANTDRYRNYMPDTVEEMLPLLDKLGSAETDPHYPRGWAQAGNAPLKRWKQDTHAGGNTDPFIISWPKKIKDKGGIRRQYHHVVDVVPTLLEIITLPAPTSVNGVEQQSLHGVSMAYSFDEAKAPNAKKVQYYEMLGSRAIWSEGWTAVAWHKKGEKWEDDKWELYHSEKDFSQVNDLAKAHPEKLEALKKLWWEEAEKYNVLPLDDRRYERVADPSRPVASVEKPLYTYYPGTSVVHPLAAPKLLGKTHTIMADVTIPEGGAEGVLACMGTEFGGWTLYIQDNKLHYVHNHLKLKEYHLSSSEALKPGKHQLGVRYTHKESSLKPDIFTGDVTLMIDGKEVATLEDVKTAGQYSTVTGYGLLIGRNTGTPVSHSYKVPFTYTGKIEKVTIQTQLSQNHKKEKE